MTTLSLVLVATIIALAMAVPVGIWAARSDRVSGLVRPVLDFMQTLPAMIYLIPAILFFGTGAPAGIVATLIFALAPGVRMTELGIRQVDKELVEAADAFGTTPRDTLLRIQLPLALPTVMAVFSPSGALKGMTISRFALVPRISTVCRPAVCVPHTKLNCRLLPKSAMTLASRSVLNFGSRSTRATTRFGSASKK